MARAATAVLGCVGRALQDAGVEPGDCLLLAVSGGADSMVLLDVLARLRSRQGFRLHVGHIHHGLRGRAADQDAALVLREAQGRGIPVSVIRLAPADRSRGASVQMWAREERYRHLDALRDEVGASRILTAHTQDDQAETVLGNLLRGTGPLGLAGIPAARGSLLRPLLTVTRAEVEAYARAARVRFREDRSNRSDAYRRNRIRRHLLPLLAREYNPRIVASLSALASLLREDELELAGQGAALLRQAAFLEGPLIRVDAAALEAAGAALRRRLVQEAFRRVSGGRHGLTRRHIEAIEALARGAGRTPLPGGYHAWRSGGEVRIGPAAAERGAAARPGARDDVVLRPGAWARWRGWRVRVRRVTRPPATLTGIAGVEVLSPQLLQAPLRLRGWRTGDRFRPLGLTGQKKLQDFFTDLKVPRPERGEVPLLLSGERIACVIGHRIAEEFRWEGRGAACLLEARRAAKGHAISAGPRAD
ncbi:MAG TPA: tRNA lysidine(34) synthetase TilS [Candidatus Sulfotelmatobacter sp.]|nr:tRNA lysidine(34) synthetase TilS [Candidatus Sulfotelmatobacter sp.]